MADAATAKTATDRGSFASLVKPPRPSGHGQPESVPASITPVDEKRFEAEVRRLDSDIGAVKTAQEKLEARVEKKLDVMHDEIKELKDDVKELKSELKSGVKELRKELKGDIKDLRTELKGDINRLEARLWWLFGAIMVSILVPIALQYFAK
ncbi:MAG: hypothetical protein LBR38_05210 [Synergistaceae bacterium]|jgi:peptidoglycan hydrolase CwlO-like protein|nr:hypothetical protein [Synergistaceae bacterium]